jgi:hypothetical protein
MGFNDYFESTYVSAADLNGRDLPVVIDKIVMEKVGKQQETRPVMYVKGGKKGVVLNRTNFRAIAKVLGQDDTKWSGGKITLYPTVIEFEGEPRDAIRVRPAVGDRPNPAAPTKSDPPLAPIDDENLLRLRRWIRSSRCNPWRLTP